MKCMLGVADFFRISCAGVGISSLDVPHTHFSRRLNRQILAILPAPEPSDTGLVLRELLEDLKTLGADGLEVTLGPGGRTFTHRPFLASWAADSQGMIKVCLRGGNARKFGGCRGCMLESCFTAAGPHPAGYVEPVPSLIGFDSDGEPVTVDAYAGDACLRLSHEQMLEQGLAIERLREEAMIPGHEDSRNRARDLMQAFGCTGASKAITVLGYTNYELLFDLAPSHNTLLGNLKKILEKIYLSLQSAGQGLFRRVDSRSEAR